MELRTKSGGTETVMVCSKVVGHRVVAFAVAMIIATSVFAQSGVEAVIDGPDGPVPPGTMVVLSAQGSTADALSWQCCNAGLQLLVVEKGTICAFATSKEGVYTIILAAAKTGDDGKAELSTARKEVIVGRSGPNPPGPNPPGPGPEPNPPEPDPLPEGKYKLAADALRWTESVEDRSLAIDLAAAFEASASQIAAGTVTTLQQFQSESQRLNRQALGDSVGLWKPFFESLQIRLKSLNSAGHMVSLEDHAVAWEEIAIGLRRAGEAD